MRSANKRMKGGAQAFYTSDSPMSSSSSRRHLFIVHSFPKGEPQMLIGISFPLQLPFTETPSLLCNKKRRIHSAPATLSMSYS